MRQRAGSREHLKRGNAAGKLGDDFVIEVRGPWPR